MRAMELRAKHWSLATNIRSTMQLISRDLNIDRRCLMLDSSVCIDEEVDGS